VGLSTVSASVRPSAAAFAVAAVDGCRDATCCWYEAAASDDDDGGGVSTAVVPTLDDLTARDYAHSLQTGLLDRWGTPRQRPPLEEDPQALADRVRPSREGFPLGEDDWVRIQAQPTQSTPTRALLWRNTRSYNYTRRRRSRSNRGDIIRLYIATV